MTTPENLSGFLADWQSAELAAVEHMRELGFIDAQTTPAGADGGIDVTSSEAVAQVKFYANPVGRPDIQKLRGAAHEYRVAIFYSTGGYSREALEYADQTSVALFKMDALGKSEPVSRSAAVLTDRSLVEERASRLASLKATRYQLATIAFDYVLSLYSSFVSAASLQGIEARLFDHLTADPTQAVAVYKQAVASHDFTQAESAFSEINKRIDAIAWITGSELQKEYEDLDDAISAGWALQSTPGSEYMLHRIALGVFQLREVCEKSLDGWDQHFPSNIGLEDLQDDELRRSAGVLLSVATDPSMLPPALRAELKAAVENGVRKIQATATSIFDALFATHHNYGLTYPRVLTVSQLRINALAERICTQLEAS